MTISSLQLRLATTADRAHIYRLRHEVYASELGQHHENGAGLLTDALDAHNVYVVAAIGAEIHGFVSVTPPWAGGYSVDKYVSRAQWPALCDDALFEVRILTVRAQHRGSPVGPLLMYAALRWIASRGGRRIVAIGRTEVLDLYLKAGLRRLGQTVTSGAVTFELMCGEVRDISEHVATRYDRALRRLEPWLDWKLDLPLRPDGDGCTHGGASFDAIGPRFDSLRRRRDIVAADVLDAWFPPAPGALEALTEDPAWLARTSPPAAAEGLIAEIAAARGIDEGSVAVGAGSSDLVFRAFRAWLRPDSRVLLLDPTYGEYAHVVERVVGCRADRLPLRRDQGWRVDPDRLADSLRTGYDLVVLVNPNNPTGRHVSRDTLRAVFDGAPESTRIWLDEAYVEYAGPGQSLEPYAAQRPNTVVCKSMSKIYALSGLRVAYLVGAAEVAAQLRRWTPPWPVSLPAQLAAVRALRDRLYYESRWEDTRLLRDELAAELSALAGVESVSAGANFALVTLAAAGATATDVVLSCRQRGVYLRDLTALSPAFEQRTLRVAVRRPSENTRIVGAVAEALGIRAAVAAPV